MTILYDSERLDHFYDEELQIIQSDDVFSFSLDAVLLADFVRPPKKGQIIDLCAGNGAVSLFVARRTNAAITAVEIQKRLADMADRSVQLNQLSEQIKVLPIDLNDSLEYLDKDSIDLIMCNPPYFKELPTNRKNPNPYLAIARHEIKTNLTEIIALSSALLKTNGKLALVHRPDRLLEILSLMTAYDIAPKRLRFIYPKVNREANIILIEGIRRGKINGLKVLPPLFVYDETNHYLPEMQAILDGH